MTESSTSVFQAAEHLVGFAIVLATLALLWGLTSLMGMVVARFTRATSATSPAAATSVAAPTALTPAAAQSDTGLADDDVAVIAAVTAMMLDRPHRLVSVRPAPLQWGQQGRRDIHASHRIR